MATETQAASATQPAPKKGRKLLIIISSTLLVLAMGGGGAGWYFFMKPADANVHQAPPKPKPAVFLPLETFTVNLLAPDGEAQFMQTGVTLKVDQSSADLIKERMPEVRDRILMVLSGKKGSELIPVGGKQKLASEISAAVRGVIAPQAATNLVAAAADAGHAPTQPAAAQQPLVEVLFTAFIIQ